MWQCEECGEFLEDCSVICWKCGTALEAEFDEPLVVAQEEFDQSAAPEVGEEPEVDDEAEATEFVPVSPTRIDSQLLPAILVTLFCCVPTGIAAIVYAAQANARKDVGDITGAIAASQKAQFWCRTSFILGLLALIITLCAP